MAGWDGSNIVIGDPIGTPADSVVSPAIQARTVFGNFIKSFRHHNLFVYRYGRLHSKLSYLTDASISWIIVGACESILSNNIHVQLTLLSFFTNTRIEQ